MRTTHGTKLRAHWHFYGLKRFGFSILLTAPRASPDAILYPLGSDKDYSLFIFVALKVVRNKRILHCVLQDNSRLRDGDARRGKRLSPGVLLLSKMPSEILRRGQILPN